MLIDIPFYDPLGKISVVRNGDFNWRNGWHGLLIAFSQLNLILLFFTLVYLGYAITDVIISAMILDVDRQRNYQIVGNLSFFVAIGSILMMGLYY